MTLEDLGYKLIEKEGKYYYNGYLDLNYTKITTLPDNLVVSGSLYLNGTEITSLPDNLVVGGSLFLNRTNITTLPDNLIVGGNIDLYHTDITYLPNNLVVGGGLDISDTNITSLPDNLVIGGSIYLEGTKITSLPDNLIVGDSICFDNTMITREEVNKVNHNVSNVLFWKDKEYVKIVMGRPFYRVISNNGSIYEVSWRDENKIYYLITNSDCSKYIIENNLDEAKRKYNLLSF